MLVRVLMRVWRFVFLCMMFINGIILAAALSLRVWRVVIPWSIIALGFVFYEREYQKGVRLRRDILDWHQSAGKATVEEATHWIHSSSGAVASIYGKVPWSDEPGNLMGDWIAGWAIRWENGKVWAGEPLFKSKAEAERWLAEQEKSVAKIAEYERTPFRLSWLRGTSILRRTRGNSDRD